MKLVHVDLEKPIAIHRNCPTEWIIESPELFLKYVEQLQKQNQGEEGNFVLSKADTELNMKRDVELVLTPFSLDFADHRIQKRLFTELVKSAQNEEMFLETQRIISCEQKTLFGKNRYICIASVRRDSGRMLSESLDRRKNSGLSEIIKGIRQYSPDIKNFYNILCGLS